jgi:hypothetical protein
MLTRFALTGALAVGLVFACDKKDADTDRGAAPPPVVSSKPGVCSGGGGTLSDAPSASFFPRVSGSYCVDPNGEVRAYGERASGTLDEVCTQLFDGECEVYKGFGLKRVVTLRYVDGKGSPASVNINLSQFADREGAYGFFTKRVVGDSDPSEATTQKLEAGGDAALGSGISYVWRGEHVAELSYTNELESPDQLRQSSHQVLPGLSKEVGDKLPGDTQPPKAVQALPAEHRLPLGVSYESKDVLGVSGLGPGAIGFYKQGDRRWRVFAIVRADEEAAKDVMKTVRKLDGARTVKGAPFEPTAFARTDEGSPRVEWLVTRKGSTVLGIGDEEFALSSDQSAEDANKVRLAEAAKIELLGKLSAAE